MDDNSTTISIKVIGFVTALLIFTANHTHREIDLLDSMIDYVQSQSVEVK